MTALSEFLTKRSAFSVSPRPNKWLVTVTIMLVTIIELLDMTIVVVAMHAMMGALSADREQITWMITAYIVAAAIVILLTGFLTTRFGRRRVLLIAVCGFMLSSALCGLSTNIMMMVVFRIFQGCFGAVFIPTSQSILKTVFSDKEQGTAMAIWGIGMMVAPVLGPTIGGYIVDHLSWRWCFYINIPVCIVSFFMILKYIEKTPRQQSKIDWLGIALVIAGVGALQFVLDQGNSKGWLSSHLIQVLTVVSAGSLIYLIYHCLTDKNPILNLRLFKDYNFSICTLLLGCFIASALGTITLQPILMEQLMHYPAETTGLLLAPRGLASAVGMFVTGQLMRRLDPRWFIAAGIATTFYGTYMMANYNLQMSPHFILLSSLVQGAGMGMSIVPLSILCTQNFAKTDIPQGTALFSFSRSLGNAIGVSILTTIITQQTQINWNRLGGHLRANSVALQQWFQAQHASMHNPIAITHLANILYSQSSTIAFVDMFWFASMILLILLPFVFFLKTR